MENPKEYTGRVKPPLSAIPSGAEIPVALVHQYGHDKHGPFNWRETPINCMTYAHAVRRHLAAWIDGEDNDPETGQSHWAHIVASGNIVLDAMACGTLTDNRPPKGNAAKLIQEATHASQNQGHLLDSPKNEGPEGLVGVLLP